jgi:hypothetical protein
MWTQKVAFGEEEENEFIDIDSTFHFNLTTEINRSITAQLRAAL